MRTRTLAAISCPNAHRTGQMSSVTQPGVPKSNVAGSSTSASSSHGLAQLRDIYQTQETPEAEQDTQQEQEVGAGTTTRSRGRCSGNGFFEGRLRVKASTTVGTVRNSVCGRA